jgi:hypothetical protein
MEKRYTPAEAAEIAKRHEETITKALRQRGGLHGSHSGRKGRWLIRESCLDAWLDHLPCEHQMAVAA